MIEKGLQVLGIKKVTSAKSGRVYTTYYCQKSFTDYELDNCETYGVSVEEVTTTEEFDIVVGDIVEFNYDKAIGNYQPVKSYVMIKKNPMVDKDKK